MRLYCLFGIVALALTGCTPCDVPEAAAASQQQEPTPAGRQTVFVKSQGKTRMYQIPKPKLDDAPEIKVETRDDGNYDITFSSPKPPPESQAKTD